MEGGAIQGAYFGGRGNSRSLLWREGQYKELTLEGGGIQVAYFGGWGIQGDYFGGRGNLRSLLRREGISGVEHEIVGGISNCFSNRKKYKIHRNISTK